MHTLRDMYYTVGVNFNYLMNRILIFLLIGLSSCSKPFDFGDETWVLRWNNSSNDYQDHYFRVAGDTMKVIWPGTFYYSISKMDLTSDSLTLHSPCVTERVGYLIIGDQLRIDSNYSVFKLKKLTSIDYFQYTDLNIKLKETEEVERHLQSDSELFIGKQNNSVEFKFNKFFEDEYMLKISNMYVDSSDIYDWAEQVVNSHESTIRIALYIDFGFGNKRTDQLIEYLTKVFNGNAEFYDGLFSPKSEFYIKLKKRNAYISFI